MKPEQRLIVALDNLEEHEIVPIVRELAPHVGMFKIGLELIIKLGAGRAVNMVREEGGKVFLDGKFHDITQTMAMAAQAASRMQVEFFTIHACAGSDAVHEAVEASRTKILGVTVLTSIDEHQCLSIFGDAPDKKVLQFAGWMDAAGADGIVCSPREAARIRLRYRELILVTPGIRPAWACKDDKSRITTPAMAVKNGADYLVIGRPVTRPPREIGSRADAAKRVVEEIASAEGGI